MYGQMDKQRAETKQADDLKWDECTEENINSKYFQENWF